MKSRISGQSDRFPPNAEPAGRVSSLFVDRWRQPGEAEADLVQELTRCDEISGVTRAVREFETRWRRWSGARHALTTMNGSAALFAAYFGLGIGPGDEVICPTYTWINTVGPALLLGARPVFCECEPETLLIDPSDARRRITPRTRAIVAVHLWGNVCDMDALLALRRDTGIHIVEDCSHAHGATWKGKVVGTVGDAGCWSLQGAKLVSAGEGGVLATGDPRVFERACLVGQLSRMGALNCREHVELQPFGLGMKLRAHPLGIAIAGVGLDRLPEVNRRRRAWVETVEAGLSGVPGFRTVKVVPDAERVWYREFPVLHLPEEHRGTLTPEVIDALKGLGVPASGGGFPLLHRLPLFEKGFDLFTRERGPLGDGFQGYREGDLPHTEEAHRRLVFFPVLTQPDPDAAGFLVDRVRSLAIGLAGDRG
ncbi:MAG: DegT/DnrJ/EryC1/StrS family aminotransferase [Acidobacteria bacterium]|nr:DegT/DnrJ/EryC1/StrS family aminotransferase [Acidobacteriota bacterium]